MSEIKLYTDTFTGLSHSTESLAVLTTRRGGISRISLNSFQNLKRWYLESEVEVHGKAKTP